MRYLLASTLLLTALPAFYTYASEQKIMYVGDSLTHGYSSSSYRWHLHKMLVDSELEYSELGINKGNVGKNQLKAGSSYRAVPFENIHSAQSSARAWEIAGFRAGSRFAGTKLDNWLGLDSQTAAQKAYTGQSFAGDQAPDIFVMMIGTNDLLSDNQKEPKGLPGVAAREIRELLTHVASISKSMLKGNPKAKIYLMTVPAWGDHRHLNLDDWRKAVAKYNKALAKWAKGKKNITLIDASQGLIAEGLKAHRDFFIEDGLHFSEQGNLLIAGNIARAMGLSGRTAGLERKGHKELNTEQKGDGLTIDMSPNALGRYGIGNGQLQAGLEITPNLITWRSGEVRKALYAGKQGISKKRVRVTWVKGDASKGIDQGYYVWLGNQLIGEALPSQATSAMKGCFPNKECEATIIIDKSASYAPALP